MPDTYLTLRRAIEAEPPKSKGSRFIGHAAPAATEVDALAVVEAVRKREHAARHWCWAYRLGASGETWRANDDGEPNGTGGRPILQEIEGRNLTNIVVVVTRYYGGTKLGAGGLARAYGEAAVLSRSTPPATSGPIRTATVRVPLTLHFAFDDTSAAMRTVQAFDAEIRNQRYSASGAALVLAVRRSEAEPLAAQFVEATAGRGRVEGETL